MSSAVQAPRAIGGRAGLALRRRRLSRVAWPVAFLVVLLVAWEVVGRNRAVLTSQPTEVVGVLVDSDFVADQLLPAFGATLAGLGVGYLVGSLAGILIGYAMGASRLVDTALEPYVNALYATPRIALIPLLILWAGIGFQLRVTIVALSCVFPLIINTYRGAVEVASIHHDVASVAGASRWQRWRTVTFPSSVPHLAAGLRIGMLRGLAAAIVAEMVAAISGTGKLLLESGRFLQTDRLFATLIALGMLGILLSRAIEVIAGWLPGARRSQHARGGGRS